MSQVTMREVREGEVPFDGGTAVQEDPDRPVFRGNGPDDYVCVACGNVLAEAMDAQHMTYRVRVRCGRCRTVNVAPGEPPPRRGPERRPPRPQLS
jgi:ribosomal protein S27AE